MHQAQLLCTKITFAQIHKRLRKSKDIIQVLDEKRKQTELAPLNAGAILKRGTLVPIANIYSALPPVLAITLGCSLCLLLLLLSLLERQE